MANLNRLKADTGAARFYRLASVGCTVEGWLLASQLFSEPQIDSESNF